MKSLFAIAQQTIRCGLRSKVFGVLFVMILLAVFLLPTTVSGDGTITTLVQITLTYSLNVIIALISATTLWLGCTLLSTEIENYTMHMVVVKPCPRWKICVGKWLGLFCMNVAILLVSAFIVYCLIMARVYVFGRYTEKEHRKLDQEILVGRREFRPDKIDLDAEAEKEYQERLKDGRVTATQSKEYTIEAIREELVVSKMRQTCVNPGENYVWTYSGVKLENPDDIIFLRYRFFTGDVSEVDQREDWVTWNFKYIPDEDATGEVVQNMEFGRSFVALGGVYYEYSTVPGSAKPGYETSPTEFPLYARNIIDKKNGGKVSLIFYNYGDELIGSGQAVADNSLVEEDPMITWANYRTFFLASDGPVLMCRVIGFTENYLRAILMAIMQLAFLAALGCTVGAIFSAPVAVFVAVTYLCLGMIAPMAVAPVFDDFMAKATGEINTKTMTTFDAGIYYLAKGVMAMTVSVDELNSTSDLSEGRLIEGSRLGITFVRVICVRSLIIALLGIWILQRRELGLVVRRN